MAIKNIITRGYGFADGTIYIATRGYLPKVVAGPIRELTLWTESSSLTLEDQSSGLHVLEADGVLTLETQSPGLTLFDADGELTVDDDS